MGLDNVFAIAICGCDNADDQISCQRNMMEREHSFLFLPVISNSDILWVYKVGT